MAKYDMAWKELFDIDPELSAEGKKVMRALQSRRVWPQKDFLGLMQGVVPGQVDAVKAELEELGYVAERTEHEFVESWPIRACLPSTTTQIWRRIILARCAIFLIWLIS